MKLIVRILISTFFILEIVLVLGQNNNAYMLLNVTTRDSVFRELLLKNNLVDKLNFSEKFDFESEVNVSDVIVCKQKNGDTLFLVLKDNYYTDSVDTTQLFSNCFWFDVDGKSVSICDGRYTLRGVVRDLNSDEYMELLDSYLIGIGKACKTRLYNYLYCLEMKPESNKVFGIVFPSSWHWKVVDLNDDGFFEIQIGPARKSDNISFWHNNEIAISSKVTFFWSKEKNMYYTTDTEYSNSYIIIDFEIANTDEKAKKQFYREVHKLKRRH